ncbi:MAG: cytosine deaminase [Pseudomonadota bacterium]
MSDFLTLPKGPFTLENATLFDPSHPNGLSTGSVSIADGHIVDGSKGANTCPSIDAKGGIVLPTFVDMHTHLDKGHIWGRAPNPDGTFMGALTTVGEDRVANWSAEDVRARMNFSLKCAYAHGTSAVRTHLDSLPPQDSISWPVFRELREEWAGRITLQAACLVPIDMVENDGGFLGTANTVAESGGTLGAVTYPMPDLAERLETFFAMAAERGLDADFHADETGDPSVATLRTIAETVLKTGFDAPVTVGHCCSLAVQDESEADRTLDLVAKAGLNIVSLPLCNLYLQARDSDTTPRWRGVTLVHEMRKRGINVSFASDNTRDPFYAYGDLDMVEVLRESTRIAHLDHTQPHWFDAFCANPANACGLTANDISVGSTADFIVFKARSMTELLARPQSDRVVVRQGKAIDRTLPDYAELDHLMTQTKEAQRMSA